jgi:signal transduction histidine kinase
MNKKIKILHLEDSLNDSELIQSLIERGGIIHDYFLADNEKDYLKFLEKENIDIILSDYNLPSYNGNEALKVAKEKYSGIPFIYVSGTMGEDTAINTMLNGATDYVLKNKLERLVPAIKRSLKECKLESGRKQAEIELKEKNDQIKKQNDNYVQINKELAFQNEEREKRAAELVIANTELLFQNQEKGKRSDELIIANKELENAKEEINQVNTSLEKKVKNRTEELAIANKTKDIFFSIIAHDLKNPFAGLLSSSELLKSSIAKQDMIKIKKYADSISSSSKNAYCLLENLLKWASLQLGKLEVKKEKFNICLLISEALTTIQNIANEKEIEIKIVNRDVKNCNVIFDLEMFKALIRNLVTNAIKFSNKGEKVFIEFFDSGKTLLTIKVIDKGIGISKKDIDNLFKIDVSHLSHGTNNETGTGLGLLLCRDFAKINGSDIFVESEPGKGSTFSFSLEKVLE